MDVVIAVTVAAAIGWFVIARAMPVWLRLLFLLSAIGVYAVGVLVWMFGAYLNVLPFGETNPVHRLLITPIVLPFVYLAWLVTAYSERPGPHRENRARRAAQFSITVLAGVVSTAFLWEAFVRTGKLGIIPAMASLSLMLLVPLVSVVARPRDPSLSLFLLGCSLVLVVPVVIAGRFVSPLLRPILW